MFDIAHPDAVVMSTEFVQIIPFGDVLLFFNEKIVYAPYTTSNSIGKNKNVTLSKFDCLNHDFYPLFDLFLYLALQGNL